MGKPQLDLDIEQIKNQLVDIVEIDIRNFGIKGDKVTDDTVGLKAALASITPTYSGGFASLYKKGGKLKLPKGVYRYTDTLRIPVYTTIEGEGSTVKWSYDLDNPSGTILYYDGNPKKPAVTFVGYDNNGNLSDKIIITGEDLDNGLISQNFDSVLKNISVISATNGEIGVVFGGCPTSRIENISIIGFDFNLLSSGHWGSSIKGLFSRAYVCGYYGSANVNNPHLEDFYIDKIGTKTSISDEHSCYNLLQDTDLKYKNVDTGFISLRHYNMDMDNLIIEHFTRAIQVSSDMLSGNNIKNVWIEGNDNQIAIMYGIYKFESVYCYKVGTTVFDNYDGRLKLENVAGSYANLYVSEYGNVAYENCMKDGVLKSSWKEVVDGILKYPSVRVSNSSDLVIPTDSNTNLTFNTELFDTDSIHDLAINSERLTCKTAGKYMIFGNVSFDSASNVGSRELHLVLNNSTTIAVNVTSAISGGWTSIFINTVYALNVGDYITLRVRQTSGGDLNIKTSNEFSPHFGMVKVG